MAISRIVGRRAYSGTHVIHSSTGEIEREVPAIVPKEIQETAIGRLEDNKRYSGGRPVRNYLLRGLIRCARCDWNYSGLSRKREGRYHFKYTCPVSSSRRFDPHVQRGGCPWLDALWLEGLVWQDIRGFVENPGEVLGRVKEQTGERRSQAGELEERHTSLTSVWQQLRARRTSTSSSTQRGTWTRESWRLTSWTSRTASPTSR
jgi:site-specific DNA recombinase